MRRRAPTPPGPRDRGDGHVTRRDRQSQLGAADDFVARGEELGIPPGETRPLRELMDQDGVEDATVSRWLRGGLACVRLRGVGHVDLDSWRSRVARAEASGELRADRPRFQVKVMGPESGKVETR